MSHDVADALHIGIFRNFDDQFIVDMSADETVFQVLHGIAENVAADSLGDILDVFRAVGFDPLLESGGNVRHGTVENVSHEPIKLVAN